MKFLKKDTPLKILFVGPEAAPYVKIGGLGEVLRSLPCALRDIGHDARVIIPKYAAIPADQFDIALHAENVQISNGPDKVIVCNVKVGIQAGSSNITNYFLENQEFFEQRGSVYGYDDDAARWAVLCRGTLEFIRSHSDWIPDIIVGADWQSGLIPNLLKTEFAEDPVLSKIASVFSIHNLHFQGMFDPHYINELEYDDGQSAVPLIGDPALLKKNFMRRGIRFADVVNTVSPTYAQEITTSEFGELLNPLLQERRSRLFGILNGIDYESNSPELNPYVEVKYSSKNFKDRKRNKLLLQKKFNLEEEEDVPIFAIVSRLSEQKGLDLLIDTMEPLLNNYKFQLIVLGSGDSRYLSLFSDLEKRFPQVATHLSFDRALPHMIYSGCDVVLVPSRFEPCGLTQMEAMRYGAVPLVRKTGGLADSVQKYSVEKDTGTGFMFENYDKYAFFGAFVQAIETYKYQDRWKGIQKRAMESNFSWSKSAIEYIELFKKAIAFKNEQKD
ncbi:MAG: glycogen synthase GlgA [Candidatus Parcubacteria bacterium]|jgi:starch synthase